MAYQNQRLGKCRKQCPATLSLFFWGGGEGGTEAIFRRSVVLSICLPSLGHDIVLDIYLYFNYHKIQITNTTNDKKQDSHTKAIKKVARKPKKKPWGL